MVKEFKAIVVDDATGTVAYGLKKVTENELSAGDVLIKVSYSSINYKDMLAVQPNGGVIRNYPMIPGIDLSGVIVASSDPSLPIGQKVLVTGYQMGMSHTGGFAEYARVPAAWVIPLPASLSLKAAMIYGTAGLTAALSVRALEKAGMQPATQPKILVTGATGGVGSLSLKILQKAGYADLTALIRKEPQADIALNLGASAVLTATELAENTKPLQKQTFHYALDTVGGEVAAAILPKLYYGGSLSMCGNAGGVKFTTTVLPFILRGIQLLGIDSVNISAAERQTVWELLANQWNIADETLYQEITLEQLATTVDAVKNGQHLGRTIIAIDLHSLTR